MVEFRCQRESGSSILLFTSNKNHPVALKRLDGFYFVVPTPGFEPGITVSKTVVISISLRGQVFACPTKFCNQKLVG